MVLGFIFTLCWIGMLAFIAIRRSWLRGVSSYKGIKCSPQRYLRGSRNSVAQAVIEHIKKNNPDACADPKTIEKVIELIDTYTSIKYSKIESELCRGYDAYDPAVHHHSSSTFSAEAESKGISEVKESTVEMEEDVFLGKIVKLLEEANFKPLSKKEMDLAIRENYTITVPIENDWDKLDTEMISSYYKQNGEKVSTDSGDKVMIFHRGVTLDVTKDRLIWEKIDMLLAYILGVLANLLKPFLGNIFGNGATKTADGDSSSDILDLTEPFEDKGNNIIYHIIILFNC